MKSLIIVLTVLLSATAYSGNSLPASARAAHEAYINKNGAALLTNVKETLVQTNNHPAMVANMMELYSAARQNGILKNVDPDWRVPQEVLYLGAEVQRRYTLSDGKVRFMLSLSVGIRKEAELEQIQLIRYPDQVLLDKVQKIGYLWEGEATNSKDLWMGTNGSKLPAEEGLYLINIKLKNRPATQGWFLVNNLNSSASPVVVTPKLAQSFSSSQPTFSWIKFRSPEMKEGERSKIGIKISNDDEESEEVVDLKLLARDTTSYTLGDKKSALEYEGLSELIPGKYRFSITYHEHEMFGDLAVRRGSRTIVPFAVK